MTRYAYSSKDEHADCHRHAYSRYFNITGTSVFIVQRGYVSKFSLSNQHGRKLFRPTDSLSIELPKLTHSFTNLSAINKALNLDESGTTTAINCCTSVQLTTAAFCILYI